MSMKIKNVRNLTVNNMFCDILQSACESCPKKEECGQIRLKEEVCRTCRHNRNGVCEKDEIASQTLSVCSPPKDGVICTACSEYEK
jgi:hypothetical protein